MKLAILDGILDSPEWSPDGKSIVFSTNPTYPDTMWYSTNHVAIAAADGSDAATGGRVLTMKLDRNISGAEFDATGGKLFARLTDRGMTHLVEIILAGNDEEEVVRIIGGEVSVGSFVVEGGTTIALVSTASQPAEIMVLDGHPAAASRPLRQLTHVNDELLATVTLGSVEKVSFPCDDVRTYTELGSRPMKIDTVNHDVEMFVYKPVGCDPASGFKYPTVLWIHGGPVSQYDWAFAPIAQIYANRGYVVLQVNPRGSTGRGEEFCSALYADWGGPGLHDVLSAVDYAVEIGLSDPERLVVGGWSCASLF